MPVWLARNHFFSITPRPLIWFQVSSPPRRRDDNDHFLLQIYCSATLKMQDRKMQDWKMKDYGSFTRNAVSVLCMSRCILSDKLFSGGLQINVIAILFYCD